MARRRGPKAKAPLAEAVKGRAPKIRRALLRWWRQNARSYPWRERGRTPYEVLVAEMLLKRTTATAAARIYEGFLEKFPSVGALDEARLRKVETTLRSVGLQRQRAKGFKAMARYLTAEEEGEIPTDVKRLMRIPHVGSYATAAVASFALGERAAVVDSNVERILRRVFEDHVRELDSAGALRDTAGQLLPRDDRSFNYAMLDLGAAVCRYGQPRCWECPLQAACDYNLAGRRARTDI